GWPLLRQLVSETDLIHSVDLGFGGILGSAWGHVAGVRHVTQLTTDLNRTIIAWGRSPLKWQDHIQGVACNSEELRKQFSCRFPTVPNVRTVYRGVDVNSYRPWGPVAGPLANEKPVRFLYLGGFPEYSGPGYGSNIKGGKTLLSAWQAAEKELT